MCIPQRRVLAPIKLFLIVGYTLLGCSEVPPTNPYDPNTPLVQQAKSMISGAVMLPENETDPGVFSTGQAFVVEQRLGTSSRITSCQQEESNWLVENATRSSGLLSNGVSKANFTLSDIAAATYDLVVCVQGYRPVLVPGLTLERGVKEQFEFTLQAENVAQIDTFLSGTVRLEGANANQNGQTLVSAVGRPFSTVTAEDGQFLMRLPGGTYQISVSHSGYAREVIPNIVVIEGETTELEEMVLTRDRSGRVIGQLVTDIAQFTWADTTVVRLIGDSQNRMAVPTVEGRFEFSDISPGLYGLEVQSQGHLDIARVVEVDSGEQDLGSITLISEADSEDAVYLTGRALLDDQISENGSHFGIVVQALRGNELVGSTITNENGQFALVASRLQYRLRFQKPGYASRAVVVTWSEASESFELNGMPLSQDNTIVLEGQPGSVSGLVQLLQFSSVQRVQGARLRLSQTNSEPQIAVPDAEGRFTFAGVNAGEYTLKASAAGFQDAEQSVRVNVGQSANLGILSLTHLSNTGASVEFSGRVRLEDSNQHGGTSVQVNFADTGQLFERIVTNTSGEFRLSASPDEALVVNLERNGYLIPDSTAIGRFSYDTATTEFKNDAGETLDIVLSRLALDGSVIVPIKVGPAWIPAEQRHARVTIVQANGSFESSIDEVEHGDDAVFSGLPAGLFTVIVTRPGFETISVGPIQLNEANPSIQLEPMDITLVQLASASIDLDGHRIDACDLRATDVNFQRGDLSGIRLRGSLGPIDQTENCQYCNDPTGASAACQPLDFLGADFTNAHFEQGASLRSAKLKRANLFGAVFEPRVSLQNADLESANFFGATANGTDFSGANLENANFTNSSLAQATFALSSGIHPEFMEMNMGNRLPYKLRAHPWAGMAKPLYTLPQLPCATDIERTNLKGTNFAQANLTNAVLFGVDLSEATLADALIVGGDLRHVCMRDSALNLTDMSNAVLDGADMQGARLINSIMYETKVRGVDLRYATLASAVIEQASFMPREATIDDGVVDDTCASIPNWTAYYPPVDHSDDANLSSQCQDNIDNDGDGFVDQQDPGCHADAIDTGEQDPPQCADGNYAPSCRCRTRLQGANLNGANLVGARFDGADLTDVSMLGVSLGESNEFPLVTSAFCDQAWVESCIGFGTHREDIETACGVENIVGLLAENPFSPSDWSDACRNGDSLGYDADLISCLYRQYVNRETLCDAYPEPNGIYGPCLAIASFGSLEAIPQWIRDGLAPLQEAPEPSCTPTSIRATWERNQVGRTCREQADTDSNSTDWACCPDALMDNRCVTANTSFRDARLSDTEMSGILMNGAELDGANLHSATMGFVNIIGSSLRGNDLSKVNLRGSEVLDSTLAGSELTNARLVDANFRSTDLSNTNLSQTDFSGSTLRNVQLSGAHLDESAVGILFHDASWTNTVRETNYRISLPGSSFSSAELKNISAVGSDFKASTFFGSSLENVQFVSDMSANGDIRNTQLSECIFTDTTLREVSIAGHDTERALTKNLKMRQIEWQNSAMDFLGPNAFQLLSISGFHITRESVLDGVGLSEVDARKINFSDLTWSNGNMSNVELRDGFVKNMNAAWQTSSGLLFEGVDFVNPYTLDQNTLSLRVLSSTAQISQARIEQLTVRLDDPDRVEFTDLEIENLQFMGHLSLSAFNNLTLSFEKPTSEPSGEACSYYSGEDNCSRGTACSIRDVCLPSCRSNQDCANGTNCYMKTCHDTLEVEAGTLGISDGSISGSTFHNIQGGEDALILLENLSSIDGSFSNINVGNLRFDTITQNVFDELIIQDSAIEKLRFYDSDFESLIIRNLEVDGQTFPNQTPLSGVSLERTPSSDPSEACGSQLNLVLSNGADLSGADLTGLCDAHTSWHNANLQGTRLCTQDFANARNYEGTPIEVPCSTALCPSDPRCP